MSKPAKNQASKTSGSKDDPGQAMESGEPKLTGRTHGRVADQQEMPKGAKTSGKSKDSVKEAPESGRADSRA